MSDYTNEVWLDKGTYYFGTTSGNYTICYSFSPKEMGTNTSKAKAKKVAIGKKVTCNFSIGSKAKNYWFKFRVPKKKAVRIDGSGVLCDAVYLLNSKGKKQTGKIRSGKTVKLKKGNYYALKVK